MTTAHATLRYARITPRKARSVADLIRGLSVVEAQAQLAQVPRRGSSIILKLLRSAIANARDQKMDVAKLYVEKISVDQGTMLKRIMLRARGSASAIQKKMSHISITLSVKDELPAARFTIHEIPKKKPGSPDAEPKLSTPSNPKHPAGADRGRGGLIKRLLKRSRPDAPPQGRVLGNKGSDA